MSPMNNCSTVCECSAVERLVGRQIFHTLSKYQYIPSFGIYQIGSFFSDCPLHVLKCIEIAATFDFFFFENYTRIDPGQHTIERKHTIIYNMNVASFERI